MPYPNATKLCGPKGLATPSLTELLPIDKKFRSVYRTTKKIWTNWKRYNQTHFYNKETKFQVPFNESCKTYLGKSKQFAFEFLNNVMISMHQGKYVAVSNLLSLLTCIIANFVKKNYFDGEIEARCYCWTNSLWAFEKPKLALEIATILSVVLVFCTITYFTGNLLSKRRL